MMTDALALEKIWQRLANLPEKSEAIDDMIMGVVDPRRGMLVLHSAAEHNRYVRKEYPCNGGTYITWTTANELSPLHRSSDGEVKLA